MMEIVDKVGSKAMQLTSSLQKLGSEENQPIFLLGSMFASDVICRQNPSLSICISDISHVQMAFRDSDLLDKGEIHPVQRPMEDRKGAILLNNIFPGIRFYGP